MASNAGEPHTVIYQSNWDYILKHINIEDILSRLYSNQCIELRQLEKLQRTLANDGPTEAAELLFLEVLLRNPDVQSFQKLLEALYNTHQYKLASVLREKYASITGNKDIQPTAMLMVPKISPDVLGNYRLTKIGGGNSGNVYKCNLNGTFVAVKEINFPPRQQWKPESRNKTMREIETSARIRHPNVVQLMAYAFESSTVLIVYEFIDGENLETIISNPDINTTQNQKQEIARHIISAVAYLHESDPKVIHGDIKPANIVVSTNRTVAKLCDLGTCKIKPKDAQTTAECLSKVGTLNYMSPEEVLYQKATNTRTDVYSLGVTLVELFIEDEYWKQGDDNNMLEYISNYMKQNKMSSQLGKIKSEYLKEILLHCLDYDEKKRITATELAAKFEAVGGEVGCLTKPFKEQKLQKLPQGPGVCLLLLGKTGAGKSSTGNTILSTSKDVFIKELFACTGEYVSVTGIVQKETRIIQGREITVVDTPGTCDTSGNDEMILRELVSAVVKQPSGYDAIVVVMRYPMRLTPEEYSAVEKLTSLFGNDLYEYGIVVFTGGDLFQNDQTRRARKGDKAYTFHDYIYRDLDSSHPGAIGPFVNRFKGGVVLFNNYEEDPNKRDDMVSELLQKIDALREKNGGKCFDSEIFKYSRELDSDLPGKHYEKEWLMVGRIMSKFSPPKSACNIS